MRINKYVALASTLSRRKVDEAIAAGRVTVNGQPAAQGTEVNDSDIVTLDGHALQLAPKTTIMLNKPVGYVVSRNGQGSRTIYDLLLPQYQQLQPVGRLDKDSSGLLLLTNDGDLANDLTHPSAKKMKVYEVTLDKPLTATDWSNVVEQGVELEDGLSKFDELRWLGNNDGTQWAITMHEGRNRQIRHTFAALGYQVKDLHRVQFGDYHLRNLGVAGVKLL